jgi:hypothetical protein
MFAMIPMINFHCSRLIFRNDSKDTTTNQKATTVARGKPQMEVKRVRMDSSINYVGINHNLHPITTFSCGAGASVFCVAISNAIVRRLAKV